MRFAHTSYDDARGIEMRLFGLQANGMQIAAVLRQSVEALGDDAHVSADRSEDGLRIIEIASGDGQFLAEARVAQGEIVISNRLPDGTFSATTGSVVARIMELAMRRLAERLHMTEFELGRDLAMLFATEGARPNS